MDSTMGTATTSTTAVEALKKQKPVVVINFKKKGPSIYHINTDCQTIYLFRNYFPPPDFWSPCSNHPS